MSKKQEDGESVVKNATGLATSHNLLANVVNKGGRFYYRYRATGGVRRSIRLPDLCDSSFAIKYAQAQRQAAECRASLVRPRTQPEPITQNSFSDLIHRYRKSELGRHSPNTQRNYSRYLDDFDALFGSRPVSALKTPGVIQLRDSLAETPGTARNFLAVLKVLMNYGIVLGMIEVNPCDKVKMPKCEEHKPWPQHVIATALQEASPMLRLAIQTALYSGQRIGDIIRFTHEDLGRDPVVIEQQKRRSRGSRKIDAVIPVHPGWLEAISQVERKADTLLYDNIGRPFKNTEPMQSQMRALMEKLGYANEDGYGVKYTFHGLRKNAANYLAEVGLSTHEIGSICGMSLDTVMHYTRGVTKHRLAENSRARITGSDPNRTG